ncbi:hypothetical protein MFIFM68171_08415 [Madurella fahalii]|uniref:Uncharacterized protein n=1 Tax=Madurella fahalii TaxID=1157608 RepID=A0ABQ0GKJ2_9PEZI
MGKDFYWNPTDGEGYALAKSYGLEEPVPIMRTTRESGSVICMFGAAGDKYFLWNQIEDIVCEIEEPTSPGTIKEEIAKKDFTGLRLKELS